MKYLNIKQIKWYQQFLQENMDRIRIDPKYGKEKGIWIYKEIDDSEVLVEIFYCGEEFANFLEKMVDVDDKIIKFFEYEFSDVLYKHVLFNRECLNSGYQI